MAYFFWAMAGGLASLLLSLAIVTLVIVKMPPTFFLESHVRDLWVDRHPLIRWTGRILKNAVGISLVFLGMFLLVPGIPGQGLLTVLIGLTLLDFPGKRRCERALIARPRIKSALDGLRARFGKPPLQLE